MEIDEKLRQIEETIDEKLGQEIEEEARGCRELVPYGSRAIKHEGKLYCFMPNVKPECAGDNSAEFDMRYYSSSTGLEVARERHYECDVRKVV